MPRTKKTMRTATVVLIGLALLVGGIWAAEGESPAPAVATGTTLSAGMAKADITPDAERLTFQLHGYGDRAGAPATGVLDPIYARAAVLGNDAGETIAIVSVDLCYVGSELRDAVLARLQSHGFNANNLMLAATHSHSGFANYDHRYIAEKFFGEFNQEIFDLAAGGIVDAVLKAKQAMRPVQVKTATITVPGMNRNRRDPAFDIATGSGPTGVVPDRERYPTDERMTVLALTEADKIRGVIVHYTAHPTVLSPKNMVVSAEWPGVMCDTLEAELNAPALFLNGALGDAAPQPDWQDDTAREIADMKAYGKAIADYAGRALQQLTPLRGAMLRGRSVRRDMTRMQLRFAWGWRPPQFLTRLVYDDPLGQFQAMRLGNVLLMTVPGEPTYALSQELMQFCPAGNECRVVAPANGYYAYFVTPSEYDEGTYASDACLYGREAHKLIADGVGRAVMNLEAGL